MGTTQNKNSRMWTITDGGGWVDGSLLHDSLYFYEGLKVSVLFLLIQ